MAANFDTDVLVVGAGPAGLSLATELTMRGVSVIVVEQNERVGVQPRAKTTNVRTMEHMRRWGLSKHLRNLSPIPPEVPRRVRFATSLFGGDIWLFDNSFCAARQRDDRFSENAEWIPQYVIEKVLLDHVSRQPTATVRYLPQTPDFEGFDTVQAYVEAGLGPADDPHRVSYLLEHLGLSGEEQPESLSGGEARRASLARVLAPRPDILLLDEPTNHLDLSTIEWLEEELARSPSAIVLISHDRRFLERVSRATVAAAMLDEAETPRYPGMTAVPLTR